MSVIAQFKDICVFPTTVFVFESYLKGDNLLILSFLYVIIMLAHESINHHHIIS